MAGSNLGKVGNLPAILLAGPPGSAKTSTMMHSGLEPELIAGQVYQDNAVTPTRSANLWFARQTLFVDSGGAVLHTPPRWLRLVKRLEPRKLSAALGGGGQAPRAAVVCFDVEDFLKPGASESIPAAVRNLQARLGDISQALGISFPVYVLFTKCDRLPSSSTTCATPPPRKRRRCSGSRCRSKPASPPACMRSAPRTSSPGLSTTFSIPSPTSAPSSWRVSTPPKSFPASTNSRASSANYAPCWCSSWWISRSPASCAPRPFSAVFTSRDSSGGGYGDVPAGRASTGRESRLRRQERRHRPVPRRPGTAATNRAAPGGGHAPRPAVAVSEPLLERRDSLRPQCHLGQRLQRQSEHARRVLFASAAGLCLLYSLALMISYARNSSLEGRVLEAARGVSTAP